MVRRYAHLTPDYLVEFAERLSRPRAVGGKKFRHTTNVLKRQANAKLLKRWRTRRDSDPLTTWFEVTPTNSEFQPDQSLATLATFANPTLLADLRSHQMSRWHKFGTRDAYSRLGRDNTLRDSAKDSNRPIPGIQMISPASFETATPYRYPDVRYSRSDFDQDVA